MGPAVAAGPVKICFVVTPHQRWLHASRRLSLRSAVGPCLERRPCRAAPGFAENSARTGAVHRHTVRRWVPGRRAISGHDIPDVSLKCRYADCIRKSRAPSASQRDTPFPIARLLPSLAHFPGVAKMRIERLAFLFYQLLSSALPIGDWYIVLSQQLGD